MSWHHTYQSEKFRLVSCMEWMSLFAKPSMSSLHHWTQPLPDTKQIYFIEVWQAELLVVFFLLPGFKVESSPSKLFLFSDPSRCYFVAQVPLKLIQASIRSTRSRRKTLLVGGMRMNTSAMTLSTKELKNKSCIMSLFGISCQKTCCVLSLSLMSEHHCVYPGYCDAIN